jgi:hypothetical protein
MEDSVHLSSNPIGGLGGTSVVPEDPAIRSAIISQFSDTELWQEFNRRTDELLQPLLKQLADDEQAS